MKGITSKLCLVAAALALAVVPMASAVPFLQLDIPGGSYVGGGAESTFSSSDTFQLAALLDTTDNAGTYYIAVSLVPPTTTSGSLGSFEFAGTTVNATVDMAAGTPAGLPPHGQFVNFYKEFDFTFDLANKFINYDVQSAADPHAGPVADASGNGLFALFDVDTSGLVAGVEIHFDLYNKAEDGSVNKFAPFSHDAESIPEPSGFVMTALGMLALGALRRVRR